MKDMEQNEVRHMMECQIIDQEFISSLSIIQQFQKQEKKKKNNNLEKKSRYNHTFVNQNPLEYVSQKKKVEKLLVEVIELHQQWCDRGESELG